MPSLEGDACDILSRMRTSIYIPCRNAERFLAGCIGAVRAQSLPPDEIIVVDDGSTDRTAEIARGSEARVISLPSHPGLAAARNAAVSAARGELVASLDADCVPEPSWLEGLAKAMGATGAAGAGGMLVEAHQARLADRWRAVHMRQNWGRERIVNPPFLFGCNTLFRKGALEEIGLYDERCRTNGEDVDLSYRLRAKGHTLVYEPAARVRHLKRDTAVSVLRADWQWGYRSSGETMKYTALSRIVYHNYTNARYRASMDRARGRRRLLLLDMLLFPLHTCWDTRFALREGLIWRGRAGTRGGASGFSAFKAHLARLSEERFLRGPEGRGGNVRPAP